MFEKLGTEFLSQYENGGWLNALIIIVTLFIASALLHILVFTMLKRIYKNDTSLWENIRSKLRFPSFIFLMVIVLNIIASVFLPNNALASYINHGLNIFLIFTIAWMFIRFASLGKDMVLERYNINDKDNLKARRIYTQFKIIERIIYFIIIIVALAIALMTFEGIRKIGISIFASAGVAGIILGLAAQKMIGAVLAGFQIAITQPIRIDDVVIVEGEWGSIEEITLTYVVVSIWDKRRLIVPTTYFIEKPFQNWTRISADILGTVYLFVDYTVPLDEIRNELTRVLKSDENWDGNVNVLQVTNANEKTVEIRALMSASNSSAAWDMRVNVREKLIGFLQQKYPESLPKTRLSIDREPT